MARVLERGGRACDVAGWREGSRSRAVHNRLSQASLCSLSAALCGPSCTLQSLDLSSNSLLDSGAAIIGDMLSRNKTLRTLTLNRCDIYVEGAKALFRGLARNDVLQSFSMVRNSAWIDGARELGEALSTNSTLTMLDVSHNLLYSEGAGLIAAGLTENKALLELRLNANEIGDLGVKALAQALKENSTLRELVLHENLITEEGAKIVAKACARSLSLRLAACPLSTLMLTLPRMHARVTRRCCSDPTRRSPSCTSATTCFRTWAPKRSASRCARTRACGDCTLPPTSSCPRQPRTCAAPWPPTTRCWNSIWRGTDLATRVRARSGVAALATRRALTRACGTVCRAGARFVAELLVEPGCRLRELRLGHNKIADEGAVYIAKALLRNTSVEGIDMSCNRINERGMGALLDALKSNHSVQWFVSQGNRVAEFDAGIQELVERNLLLSNKTQRLTLLMGFSERLGAQSALRRVFTSSRVADYQVLRHVWEFLLPSTKRPRAQAPPVDNESEDDENDGSRDNDERDDDEREAAAAAAVH